MTVADPYVLTIDIRTHRERSLLEMYLMREDYRFAWREVQVVQPESFQHLRNLVNTCFKDEKRVDRESLEQFGRQTSGIFGIDEFFRRTPFQKEGRALTIRTIVRSIPWDLIYLGDGPLAHQAAVGLVVPTPNASTRRSARPRGRPRFVHIVSNPRHDLDVEREKASLKRLAEESGIEYCCFTDEQKFKLAWELQGGARTTPFVHFSGHIEAQRGLIVRQLESDAEDVFSTDEILKLCSPLQDDQIVFLNGCDSVLDATTDQHELDGLEMFRTAAVANAFLHAGARAVIAPRTAILDDDASEAAVRIWSAIFAGETLGEAVSRYRRETVERSPFSLAGYSYILYGTPDFRANLPGKAAPSEAPTGAPSATTTTRPLTEEVPALVLEALRETDGEIAPKHLFAALTRGWMVGHVYFDLEGQGYFYYLEKLRSSLGVPGLVPGAAMRTDRDPALSSGARLIIDRARSFSQGAPVDAHALLRALRDIGDADIAGAMRSTERGPRDLQELVVLASEWQNSERKERPALVLPSGVFDQRQFLCMEVENEPVSSYSPPGPGQITPWDLLLGLATRSGPTRIFLDRVGATGSAPLRWRAGQPLAWFQLDTNAQNAVTEAILTILDANGRLSESSFLLVLSTAEGLTWDGLPQAARSELEGKGVNRERWGRLLLRLAFEEGGAA